MMEAPNNTDKPNEKSSKKHLNTSPTEIKKMKQGMSYTSKEKTIILNVFKYFRTQYADKCVTEIVRRTAKATGCSEKSVFQFRKEEKSGNGFKEPSKTKIRKNININSRYIKYDDGVRQSIRHIIYDLKYKNIVASLNTILKKVNADDGLPNFSLMTLRRLLFDMGFCYEKDGNKSILVERNNKTKPEEKHLPIQQNNYVPETNVNIPTSNNPNYSPMPHRVVPLHIPQHDIHNHHMGMIMNNHNMGPPMHHIQSNLPIRPDLHIMQPPIYS